MRDEIVFLSKKNLLFLYLKFHVMYLKFLRFLFIFQVVDIWFYLNTYLFSTSVPIEFLIRKVSQH